MRKGLKNMENKALECLEDTEKWIERTRKAKILVSSQVDYDLKVIKQALTTKSKKEQAFDIIKEKEINITLVKLYETREEYVNSICRDYVVIRDNLPTEQEFNLLKEVL